MHQATLQVDSQIVCGAVLLLCAENVRIGERGSTSARFHVHSGFLSTEVSRKRLNERKALLLSTVRLRDDITLDFQHKFRAGSFHPGKMAAKYMD